MKQQTMLTMKIKIMMIKKITMTTISPALTMMIIVRFGLPPAIALSCMRVTWKGIARSLAIYARGKVRTKLTLKIRQYETFQQTFSDDEDVNTEQDDHGDHDGHDHN